MSEYSSDLKYFERLQFHPGLRKNVAQLFCVALPRCYPAYHTDLGMGTVFVFQTAPRIQSRGKNTDCGRQCRLSGRLAGGC